MIKGFVFHNGSKFYYQAERTAKGNLLVIDIRLNAKRGKALRLKSSLAQTVIALIEKQEKEQQNERITK